MAFSDKSLKKLIDIELLSQTGDLVQLLPKLPYIVIECSNRAAERLCVRVVLDAFDSIRCSRPKVKSYRC